MDSQVFKGEFNETHRSVTIIRGTSSSVTDVILVLMFVTLWVISIIMFYKKWDSIRIMKPLDAEFRQEPKNLETIRIIERPQDSLILDSNTRKQSFTMQNERRLKRAMTAPSFPSIKENLITKMDSNTLQEFRGKKKMLRTPT